jgi:hypothetical protein
MPKAKSSASKGKRQKKSAEEMRKYKLQWYHQNKQRLKDAITDEQLELRRRKQREYYVANKSKVCEYQRQYRASRGNVLADKKREYRSRAPEKWKAYYSEYNSRRKEEQKIYIRKYYAKHCQRLKEYSRSYAKENSEKVRECRRRYNAANAEKVRQYSREWTRRREASDHLYRLIRVVGCRINSAVRSSKSRKSGRTIVLLGCSPAELALHLEKKFKRGMGWHNRPEWHIDHVVPLAAFNLADAAEQRAAFHYSNLQPLWRHENLRKGARLPDGTSARGSRYRTARDKKAEGIPKS